MAGLGRPALAAALLLVAGLAGCIGTGEDVDLNALQGLEVEVSPEQGSADTAFTFDASDTPGADGLSFTWDFGDGANATGAVVTHTFAYDNNLYKVRVTASQGNQTLTDTVEVPVGSGQNADPTVELHPASTWVGHGEALTVHADATDPDGDPLEVRWLMTKQQGGGGDGHDHDHGGAGGGSTFGIPEDTGKRGAQTTFTFNESGTYRVVAQAVDPKAGSATSQVDIKVTQTVPKTTFDFREEGTLNASSGGAGASLVLYELLQPSRNTYIDSARYDLRLIYPGSGVVGVSWNGSAAPADLDLLVKNDNGEVLYELNERDAQTTNEQAEVDLKAGSYTLEVYGNAGAQVPYEVYLTLDLRIPGLTATDDHGDGHAHDH